MSTLFTSAVLQGLNAIDYIRDQTRPWTAISVATVIGANHLVSQRTLYLLAKAGIVHAKKGHGGGFHISEEQLKTKTVLDVMEALGQRVVSPEGNRASDRVQQRVYDALNLTLDEFFNN